MQVNDKFEFPFELDISAYLAEDALTDEGEYTHTTALTVAQQLASHKFTPCTMYSCSNRACVL
jgi:hypothetical protein